MEKPYDEVFLSYSELKQWGSGLVKVERMKDWLKMEYQADELELIEEPDQMGYTMKYKRYQLQYG